MPILTGTVGMEFNPAPPCYLLDLAGLVPRGHGAYAVNRVGSPVSGTGRSQLYSVVQDPWALCENPKGACNPHRVLLH